MSKLWIAQLVCGAVTVFAWLVIGMHLYGLGRIDPDVILPWAYTAEVGVVGMLICAFARLCVKSREKK